MNHQEIRQLVNMAAGRESADLVLVNGTLLNVFTAELLPAQAIAIKGQRIAYVGPDARHTIGPQTEVIDVGGQTLIPGFIDGHTHQDAFVTMAEYLRYIVPGGTTTLITETDSVAHTLGYRGTKAFLNSLRDQPIKVYALAVPCVPMELDWDNNGPISLEEMQRLLRLPEIVGLGEIYWPWVLDGNQRVLQMIAQSHQQRKPIEGHSAGARGKNLVGFTAAGIGSCHEPITPDEVVELLRLGVHVMLRQGSIRRDLSTLAAIRDQQIDLRRLALCTDAVTPPDLIAYGYLEGAVRQAMEEGFDPIQVIQMVTINVAEHFQLDNVIGAIAPYRFADILVVPTVSDVRPLFVISNGKVVVRDGQLTHQPRQHHFPAFVRKAIRIERPFIAEDLVVRAPAGCGPEMATSDGSVVVRALAVNEGSIITREEHIALPISEGRVVTNSMEDVLKIVLINRRDSARKCIGYCRGFGMRSSALAGSVCWDANSLLAIGAEDEEMAYALNRLVALGGGFVVSTGGKVVEELALPLFGNTSERPIEEVAEGMKRVTAAIQSLGSNLSNPLLSAQTMTFAALPFLRITDQGLIDVRARKRVGLFVGQDPNNSISHKDRCD